MSELGTNRTVVTITMLDLYLLTEQELEEVWGHLGACVRIRARCWARQRAEEEQRNA